MPGLTGLEVAQGIEGATRVVFVTAYDEYALPAFEAAAVDYLLKPLQIDRLRTTVARLQAQAGTGIDSMSAAVAALAPARPAQPLRFIRASSGDLMHQGQASSTCTPGLDDAQLAQLNEAADRALDPALQRESWRVALDLHRRLVDDVVARNLARR